MTEPMKTELDDAIQKANRALDVPNADPDDDLRLISRQFLRLLEKNERQVAAERERIKTELKEKLKGNFKMSLQRAARIQQYLPKNEILELIDSL